MNFHCAHWHSFFPLKEALSKTHQSSLTLKGGSTAFSKPLFLMEKVGCTRQYESELSLRSLAQPFPSGDKGCTNRPTRCLFFSKTYPSFLTLKEGSTSLSKPLPSQKGKDVPTALSIVFTTPSVPPCRGQKRCSNRFAIWMADHQRSTPAAELRFFVRG